MPKLVITEDGGTREVTLKSGDTIGRVADNAVQLAVKEASRKHCSLFKDGNAWFVEDLGSSNGTKVNGRKVSRFELQDGDVITVGLVEMRFLDVDEEPQIEESGWGEDDLSLEQEVFLILGGARREGEILKLPEGTITVGRSLKNTLQIKDKSISSEHARLERTGTRVRLVDLDSSNGTFLNGERIRESELESGDEVRFGAIPCTFGVGDPADYSTPVAVSGESDFDGMEEYDDDGMFELGQAPRQKDTLWNVISLLVIAGLVAGVWFLSQGRTGGGGGSESLQRGDNLLPEHAWSFELPESDDQDATPPPEWVKDRQAAGLMLDLSDEDPVSGDYVLRLSADAVGAAPLLAYLDHGHLTSSGSAFRVSVRVAGSGAIPVAGMIWLDESPGSGGIMNSQVVGKSLIYGVPAGDEWTSLEGTVLVPDGANKGMFAIGMASPGTVDFDHAILQSAQIPDHRAVAVSGSKCTLSTQGSLSVQRYGRTVIHGAGLAAREGDSLVPHDSLMAPRAESEGRVAATARTGGEAAMSLEVVAPNVLYRMVGPAVASSKWIAIPLEERSDAPASVTTITEGLGTRHGAAFSNLTADSVILGVGGDLVRVSLVGTDGGDAPLTVSFVKPDGRRPVVLLAAPGSDSLELRVQVSFGAEEQEARTLLAKARDAERQGHIGKGLMLAEQVRARFPFNEGVDAEASQLMTRLSEQARKDVAGLVRRMDDAEFFKTLTRGGARLEADLDAALKKYAGTSYGEEIAAQQARRATLLQKAMTAEKQRWAERKLIRASDYMASGNNRLARLFLESIVKEFPDSDEADQAEMRLARLKNTEKRGQ